MRDTFVHRIFFLEDFYAHQNYLIYCICNAFLSAFGLRDDKQFGFCKAKKKFYYRFKIHMITTGNDKPVEFIITPVSVADITFKLIDIDLPQGASIYGDKAYTQYSFEDDLQEFEKIRLIADRKKNATKQYSGCVQYLQTILRKRIETTFSQLTSMFPRKIHAVTEKGFLLKLIIFIISFSIEQGL